MRLDGPQDLPLSPSIRVGRIAGMSANQERNEDGGPSDVDTSAAGRSEAIISVQETRGPTATTIGNNAAPANVASSQPP